MKSSFGRLLVLAGVGVLTGSLLAGDVVEVTSADGLTTTGYETMDDGFAAANQDGMTIRLLTNITWDVSWKGLSHSLNWDLNGYTLQNTAHDFLCVGKNQTHRFYGGGTLGGGTSVFVGDGENSTVYVTNVTLLGVCTICNKGVLEVGAGTIVKTAQLASKNSSPTGAAGEVRVNPGAYIATTRWRDSNDPDPTVGVQIKALGGYWTLPPKAYLAEGRYLMWAPVKPADVQYIYEVTDDATRYANCQAIGDNDEGYPTLANAASATVNGRIRLTRDLPNTITKPTFEKNYDITLDLNGHTLELGGNCCWTEVFGGLHLTNGTVKVSGAGTQGGFLIKGDGANFTADSTVSFVHGTGSGLNSIVFLFFLWSNLSHVTLDGSKVSTSMLYSFNPDNGKYGEWYSGVTIKGDADVSCQQYSYRGDTAPAYLLQATKIKGGIFTVDPFVYLAEGSIEGQGSVSGRWRVWDLSEDMKVDLASGETFTFKGAVPDEPTQVKLAFNADGLRSKTLVGDLSGLTGNLANLSFAVPDGLLRTVSAEVVDGKLYVLNRRGTVVLFR